MRMQTFRACLLALVFGMAALVVIPSDSHAQRRGGQLKYMIPASGAPSLDAHREATFATIHPTAPFYSLLIQVDPTSKTNKIGGDLATKWTVSKDKKTYTFTLRRNVKFHDGTPLTAKDVIASWRKLVNPETYGKNVVSSRKGFFSMIESYKAVGKYQVVFKLKHPSGAFIPALAMPFNYIYKAAILEKDPHYHEKNVMGSGPFQFVEYVPGGRIAGKRNENYYIKGRPYLDGFEAIFAKKQNVYVQAIRGGRIHGVFRGLPPAAVQDLLRARGKTLTVHRSTWNCGMYATFNRDKKPFDDVRVRQAVHLALDRWAASKHLSRIAIVKTVGAYVFPGHPLAFTNAELRKEPGYGDIKKARAKARRLLKEAGQSNLKFVFHNRNTDQPYKVVGTWLIDQWRQIGLSITQEPVSSSQYFGRLRSRDYDVGIDFGCEALVNPSVDISKHRPGQSNNYSSSGPDPKFEKMFAQQLREGDPKKQRKIMLKMQRYALREMWTSPVLWWDLVLVHDKKLRGFNIGPSHYLNIGHANVWLDK